MEFINKTIENKLNNLFEISSPFKLIILWGEKGNGKSFLAHSFLQEKNIKCKDIIFSEENITPFDFEKEMYPSFYDENSILMQCSQFILENYCLFFQNMEFCDLDSQRILYRLLKYHKNNNQKAFIILEYNVSVEPKDSLSLLSKDTLFVDNLSYDCFKNYYEENFYHSKETKKIFEKILEITHRNIQNFLTTLNLLQYMDVLHKDGKRLAYNKNSTYKLPNSLLELYVDLFDKLKDYMREPLVSAAPFSKQIYSTLIHAIYNNYDRFEEYLETLCEQGCFIHRNIEENNKKLQYFQAQYAFRNEYARNAILAQTGQEKVEEIVTKYYNHLDRLYTNKQIYNNLQNNEKILLLSKLTKKRQNTLKVNQIHYVAELMDYYYKQFMYLNAIKQGEYLLESHIVNDVQLNDVSHKFWVIYFKSLLAVGDYEKILRYREHFEDDDLNYDIAVALYHYGYPVDALEILEKKLSKTTSYEGYIHLLAASIYDWLGHKKSLSMNLKKHRHTMMMN